jgi:hypothetical protein
MSPVAQEPSERCMQPHHPHTPYGGGGSGCSRRTTPMSGSCMLFFGFYYWYLIFYLLCVQVEAAHAYGWGGTR